VMYNTSGAPVWSTGTGGNTGDDLVVQNDGNVVQYSWSGVPLWSTGT
jgi:pseudomonalisin